jgi:penicillin-binding protein 2
VGRLTGQEAINEYALQFGLGKSTGIEIGDSAGALASAEYAERYDLEWSDGQTLTAAIGQSYNLFTPLQLANYTATLVGDGEYYTPHLLKTVKSYDNEELVFVYDEEADHVVEMSEETKRVVTQGMHNLTTGSLAGAFNRCVVSAGAKTGSAQVGTDIANGVFVCYAPYEDPEIAVAIVIEKGGSGAALASTAVEIMNAYFEGAADRSGILSENTLLK